MPLPREALEASQHRPMTPLGLENSIASSGSDCLTAFVLLGFWRQLSWSTNVSPCPNGWILKASDTGASIWRLPHLTGTVMPESEAEKQLKDSDMKIKRDRTSAVQLHDYLNLLALPLISVMAVSGLLGWFDPFTVTAAMVRWLACLCFLLA